MPGPHDGLRVIECGGHLSAPSAAYTPSELGAEVLKLGGDDVLARPFDPEEVWRVVGLACEHHQERQLRRATEANATTARGSPGKQETVRSVGNAIASRVA